jgi:hypothetical protein
MKKTIKWVGITGSWRKTNSKVEEDVRREVKKSVLSGKGIVTGGALNVDYQATDEVLKLKLIKQLKIFIPTTLSIFIQHYRKRAEEGVITKKQAEDLTIQLTKVKKLNSDSLIENSINKVLNEKTYFERNLEVVNTSDELIAFHVNNSGGVQDTIDKAKIKNIPVKIFSYQI